MLDDDHDDGHSFWSRPFTFGSVNVRVEELWGEGIGGTVWEGGILLSHYLSSNAFAALGVRDGRCIELGAGVSALPSLVAIHLGCFREVVVTDVYECWEGLCNNVASNLPASVHLKLSSRLPQETAHVDGGSGWPVPASVIEVLAAAEEEQQLQGTADSMKALSLEPDQAAITPVTWGVSATASPVKDVQPLEIRPLRSEAQRNSHVSVEVLDWRDSVDHLRPPFEVVLVADVVYVRDLVEPLLTCMWALCKPETVVLLAYYELSKSAHELFWSLLPKYFACTKIEESSYGQASHGACTGLFQLRYLPQSPTSSQRDCVQSFEANTASTGTKLEQNVI